MSYGVGHRRGLDLVWLRLWRKPAAIAPTQPLAWEPLGAILKRQKKSQSWNAKKYKDGGKASGRGHSKCKGLR